MHTAAKRSDCFKSAIEIAKLYPCALRLFERGFTFRIKRFSIRRIERVQLLVGGVELLRGALVHFKLRLRIFAINIGKARSGQTEQNYRINACFFHKLSFIFCFNDYIKIAPLKPIFAF
jgi:hypothetical protein